MVDSLEPKRDVRMTQGDSKTVQVDAGFGLSGGRVEYVIATKRGGTVEVQKKSGGSGIAITDASGGVFEIYLEPDDTDDLRGGYWHEAQFVDGSGDVTTIFTGRFVANPDTA